MFSNTLDNKDESSSALYCNYKQLTPKVLTKILSYCSIPIDLQKDVTDRICKHLEEQDPDGDMADQGISPELASDLNLHLTSDLEIDPDDLGCVWAMLDRALDNYFEN